MSGPKCEGCGRSGGLVHWYQVTPEWTICWSCVPLATNGDQWDHGRDPRTGRVVPPM